MLGEFERLAGSVKHSAPQMRWVSNLTGELMDWDRWSGSMGRYWREHAREAVKYEAGARAAARAGAQLFVEVGPHGVLGGLGQVTLGGEPLGWVTSLRRGRGAWEQLLESVAQVYARGVRAELDAVRHAVSPSQGATPDVSVPARTVLGEHHARPGAAGGTRRALGARAGSGPPSCGIRTRRPECRFVPGEVGGAREALARLHDQHAAGLRLVPPRWRSTQRCRCRGACRHSAGLREVD